LFQKALMGCLPQVPEMTGISSVIQLCGYQGIWHLVLFAEFNLI